MTTAHVCDEGNYDTLTLAPHQRTPIINFGHVKTDHKIERVLVIKNPQQFQVKLGVTCQGAQSNEKKLTLIIEKNSHIDFKIKWQPIEPGKYKYTISFEVIQFKELRKFHVNCYGECSASTFKKSNLLIRRPLGQLQSNGQKSFHSSYSNINSSKPVIETLGKENKSPITYGSNNKLANISQRSVNTLLFEVDPIHNYVNNQEINDKSSNLTTNKKSNNDTTNEPTSEPIKYSKFLVESIYNNQRYSFRQHQHQSVKQQTFAIYSAVQ